MLNDYIQVVKGFQTSVNIEFDLSNNTKIKNFIPTMSAIEIIEDIFNSTARGNNSRARILIGAYGRGKSHIILVVMALLFKQDIKLFENLLVKIKKYDSDLYNYIVEYISTSRKLLPIIVNGSNVNLSQSFLNALEVTLRREGLENIMPETNFKAAISAIELWENDYPETYIKFKALLNQPVESYVLSLKEFDTLSYAKFMELYPKLTSGSDFNPFTGFNVVEVYEKAAKALKKHGYDGVYVVYDEFSKYLESSIETATVSDTKLLQDFAEKCVRSEDVQMHILLISHKDVENYIDTQMPKEKQDGWRGVSGRFEHMTLHNNFAQMYEIIAYAIKKDKKYWDKLCKNNIKYFDELEYRFISNGIIEKNIADVAVKGCFPLHPVSTFILPRISEKVAQNERTLFTFLSSESKHTLPYFLDNSVADLDIITPDYIYDYFEALFRKTHYSSEINKLYKVTSNVLKKLEENDLGAKIIKTIALIYAIEQFEKLPPTRDFIIDIFKDVVEEISEIESVLEDLISKQCIIFLKQSNGYLKIKDSSGVDVQSEIFNLAEKIKTKKRLSDILADINFDNYLYPTRYNDENEIVRYFDVVFKCFEDINALANMNTLLKETKADGIICSIILGGKEDIDKVEKVLLEQRFFSERIIFVVPKKYNNISKVAYEYTAARELRELFYEDVRLSEDYNFYVEDLEEVIIAFINSCLRPEFNGATYYHKGEKKIFNRRKQLSSMLSDICDKIYPNTPIINNELINKNSLSSMAIKSRARLIDALLEKDLKPNLGLHGSGQEVSFMRSILVYPGILKNVEDKPMIELMPEDENFRSMLNEIKTFFTDPKEEIKNFEELYNKLTLPEYGYGIKIGVIPVYIAIVLHEFKKVLVIKHKSAEVKLTADLLSNINEKPSEFTVYLENWNDDKEQYVQGLEILFDEYINEAEKGYNNFAYITSAMVRWYLELPKYTKMAKTIYGSLKKEKIKKCDNKFIESLNKSHVNTSEYLFKELFSIYEYGSIITPNIIANVKESKRIYDSMKNNLLSALEKQIKDIFKETKNDENSMTSVIKDWYESLNQTTVNHLFVNNEDKILKIMENVGNNERLFIEKIARIVTGLRIDDWSESVIEDFLNELQKFKKTVLEFEKLSESNKGGLATYRISVIDNEGKEVIKTFNKTEYSNRAKLLLNDIESSIEEMGSSVTMQEKRQVLIELLEKMS